MKRNKIIVFSICILMLMVCFGCQKGEDIISGETKELSLPFVAEEVKSVAVFHYDTDKKIWYDEANDITAFVEVLNKLALDEIDKVSDESPRYPGLFLEIRGENDAICKMIIHGMFALVVETTNVETNLLEYTYYTVDCSAIISLAEQKRIQYADSQEVQEVQDPSAQWLVEPGGPIMGTGDLKFGVNFMDSQMTMTQTQVVNDLSNEGLLLYSFMPINVEIVPTDHVWTYRVYRITDGEEQEVYSQEIYNEDNPFYSGVLPSRHFAYNSFDVPYWTEETAQPGEYKIVLEHPDLLLYRDEDGELQRFRFGEGRGNGLSFTCELTIEAE